MTTPQSSPGTTVELLPCPLCGEKRISLNKPGFNYKKGSINCPACLLTLPGEVNEDELIRCWNDRPSGGVAATPGTDDEDHMQKISALIARLQSTMDQFGDTCVYIRRGGLSWGAVALNRRDDDKEHGVFDLQAQHDRDMLQRAEQVERLIASKNEWMERATKAEAACLVSRPDRGAK